MRRRPAPRRDDRQPEIERLKRENETLCHEIAERDQQIKEQEQKIADLERQLGARQQNSTTL